MSKFINLCAHDVVVKLDEDMEWFMKRTGKEARVFSDIKKSGKILDDETNSIIPVVEQQNARAVIVPGMDDFPAPETDVYYIVSAVVREFLADRQDLLSPDVGSTAKRGEGGEILYVRRMRKNGAPEEVNKETK